MTKLKSLPLETRQFPHSNAYVSSEKHTRSFYIVQSSDIIYKSASVSLKCAFLPIHLTSKIIYEKIIASTYFTTFGIL